MSTPSICPTTAPNTCVPASQPPAVYTFALQQVLAAKVCTPTLTNFLLAWADLFSLLLLILTITVAQMDPLRRIWGHTWLRNLSLIFFMSLTVTFSATRFLVEGTCAAVGSREFLFACVIYCARWLWLFYNLTAPSTRSGKAFRVAHALRELKTIRLGSSTATGRRGEKELVLRRGARVVHGDVYWRGVEESTRLDEGKSTWMIRLVEKELHSSLLNFIGTVESRKTLLAENPDQLYKTFYDLILTVDAGNPELVVDYSPFLEQFHPVGRDTRLAQRAGAVREGDLGDVARRVAADACYYIWYNGEFRTAQHVEKINEYLENAAKDFFD